MNDKLKREFNRLKIANKKFCVKVIASDYKEQSEVLDGIAAVLEKDIGFIQIEQGSCGDRNFLGLVKKCSQLTAMYDATLVIKGSLAVSFFVQPDGVILDDDDLSISEVKELLGEERIIGCYCENKDSVKKAIKSGADYIIMSTPSISTNPEKVVVIEYAKWVYENTEKPLFADIDSQEKYAALYAAKIDRFIFPLSLADSILR